MVFGIKYYTNKKGLNLVNDSLKNLGSSILPHGTVSYYFTNPILASKVSSKLNAHSAIMNYKIFMLSKDQESRIDPRRIVSSMQEYNDLMHSDRKKVKEMIDDMVL
jgi:hypothetical protein